VLLDEIGHLGVRPNLAVDPRAFAFGKNGDQRILSQLAVLVVFVCGTELLDESSNAVGVPVPAAGQPDATALVDTLDLAVGSDP
jgi:hypothetical protein